MRILRHLKEDTKRENMILARTLLFFLCILIALAKSSDSILSYFGQNQIYAESVNFHDPNLIKFCDREAITDIEPFKIYSMEILSDVIKINDKVY